MDDGNKPISNVSSSGGDKGPNLEMAVINQDKDVTTCKPSNENPTIVGVASESTHSIELEVTNEDSGVNLMGPASGKEGCSPNLGQMPDDVCRNNDRMPPEILPAPINDSPGHSTMEDAEKAIGGVQAG